MNIEDRIKDVEDLLNIHTASNNVEDRLIALQKATKTPSPTENLDVRMDAVEATQMVKSARKATGQAELQEEEKEESK